MIAISFMLKEKREAVYLSYFGSFNIFLDILGLISEMFLKWIKLRTWFSSVTVTRLEESILESQDCIII